MVLRSDFQKGYIGTGVDLRVNELKIEICSCTALNLLLPRLFAILKSHEKQILRKSRIYIKVDQQFPTQEIKHLLAGI